ncbi:MAG: alpha/beta hydrolase [Leptospiraceae bacterium]|nr:alpha/beta hydrolase [Leptospiraceae bacterium]
MEPFKLADWVLQGTGKLSTDTLNGLRSFLHQSMDWSGDQLEKLSDQPMIRESDVGRALYQASRGMKEGAAATSDALSVAAGATGYAFEVARKSVADSDRTVEQILFDNVAVASVAGSSFAGVTISKIQPSFRLNGENVSLADISEDYRRQDRDSVKRGPLLLIPGLFCDESLWSDSGQPESFAAMVRNLGYYPVNFRFNPGNPIPENGRALFTMLNEFFAHEDFYESRPRVLSYSQGGLILRAAIYLSMQPGAPVGDYSRWLDHSIFIASPDGGSYIEKLGFWIGLGLSRVPLPVVSILGAIGNERSDAMKDLSHGIIREEDRAVHHPDRYGLDTYHGELDNIPGTQIFSSISNKTEIWGSWFGDGVVEDTSLRMLSDSVFRKKKNPEDRVHHLEGLSHFQIMNSPETLKIVKRILAD